MPKRNPESYTGQHDQTQYKDETTHDGPTVGYDPEEFPDVKQALDLLNEVALLDEKTACIQYPAGDPQQTEAITKFMQAKAELAVNHGMGVISFDIDLTICTGEDHEDNAILIDPEKVSELQSLGYIVGTCSDREPSDQKQTLNALGQEPDFCIPKEMLTWARHLIPAETHLHIGDDDRRDREIALRSGWEHQWPDQFQPP